MTAVGAGDAEVYANSGRIANAVIMAPDRYWYLLGPDVATRSRSSSSGALTSTAIGPLCASSSSRGLNAGEIIVGDMDGLLVAENAGRTRPDVRVGARDRRCRGRPGRRVRGGCRRRRRVRADHDGVVTQNVKRGPAQSWGRPPLN